MPQTQIIKNSSLGFDITKASNLIAMSPNLIAMASNLIAMASIREDMQISLSFGRIVWVQRQLRLGIPVHHHTNIPTGEFIICLIFRHNAEEVLTLT